MGYLFRGLWPPELAPNKFQERPSDASRMREVLSARALPRTLLGELTALPRSSTRLHLPKNPTPALGPLADIWASPLSQNRSLAPPTRWAGSACVAEWRSLGLFGEFKLNKYQLLPMDPRDAVTRASCSRQGWTLSATNLPRSSVKCRPLQVRPSK